MESHPAILLEILVSGVLIAVTMMVHGWGMYTVVQTANRLTASNRRTHRAVHAGKVLSVVVVLALLITMLDMSVWALAFFVMDLIPIRGLLFTSRH